MDMHEAKEMMAAPALGARRFFRWWLSELGALVPSNWREHAYTDSQILIVEADETSLRVSTDHKGGQHLIVAASAGSESETVRAAIRSAAQDVGAQTGDSQQVFLRLPQQSVLSRELELPIAEESQLRQMLSLQLDNLTPFKEAEIYWDCAILEKHRERGRMRVHLVVVQRVDVDPILKRISL